MAIQETLDTLYLCWFCQPKADRVLFRCLRDHRLHRVVEVGIVSVERTLRMLRLAQRFSGGQDLHYAGIDLFDARPAGLPELKLKRVHQQLSGSGATVRLIPGDPLSAMARMANQISGTELLLLSASVDQAAMEQAWTYIPRILAGNAQVWEMQTSPTATYRRIAEVEWRERVDLAARNRRLAA